MATTAKVFEISAQQRDALLRGRWEGESNGGGASSVAMRGESKNPCTDRTRTDDFESLFRGADDLIRRIRSTFDEEGYVLVRGLFDDDLLHDLVGAAQDVVDESAAVGAAGVAHFTSMKFGPVFSGTTAGEEEGGEEEDGASSPEREEKKGGDQQSLATQQQRRSTSFRRAALESDVPRFVARVLLAMDEDAPSSSGTGYSPSATLRVLKDAFLAKGSEEKICGWHVDGFSFWPTEANGTDEAGVDAPSPPGVGVNAWVALDDIPASDGGGLAISPRSHRAPWRHDAYKALGSTRVFPRGGFQSVEEMIERGVRPQTCDMANAAPELEAAIDATKVVPDYRRGDVVFLTRWLFHRSMLPTEEGLERLADAQRQNPGQVAAVKRYTIRYEPGTARLLGGAAVLEPSVLLDPKNGGQTLDDVCEKSGRPWYPRCWPSIEEDEVANMGRLVQEELPRAAALKAERLKELAPIFAKKG